MKRFERLFSPRSIAVIGVSEDAVRPGSQAVDALRRYGYAGAVYPVNPRYADYQGLKCYPSVLAIEGEIDLAVVGIPARAAVGVIEECARKGVPYAVVPSGGFRESGPEGATLQTKMLGLAREAGMRIVGPNCLGLANIHENVYAAFGSITRPPQLTRGAVSLVTQSGGFGYSIALACARAGIGFRNVIATGNEADIDLVEFIDALIEDEETRIILAYMEGLGSGRALLDAGRRALAAGKPLLVWKGGVTAEGKRAAATHTANLTGSYDVWQALFRQAGIIEIRELHEAADFVQAFEAGKFPAGRRVAVMGGSGGSAIVFADAAEQCGLRLPGFAEKTRSRLAEVVPAIGSVENPVDFTAGYIAGGNAGKFRIAVQAVLDDEAIDAVCLNFATSSAPACVAGAEVLNEIAPATAKPIFVFQSTPADEAAPVFAKTRIPVLPSPVRVARAIAALVRYREARERNAEPEAGAAVDPATAGPLTLPAPGAALSEVESKALIASLGIAVTRERLVAAAEDFDFRTLAAPFAVKIASSDIAHKTEIGGVKLGIRTREELESAISEVLANAAVHAPHARVDGVIVAEMVTGGFELLAGVTHDASCGPVVVVGAGGIYAEALSDKACRLAPFDERTAREMLGELKCSAVLQGARGKAPLDAGAVAKVLVALSRFAWAHRDAGIEVDINPLIVTPGGAIAADALVLCRASAAFEPQRPPKLEGH